MMSAAAESKDKKIAVIVSMSLAISLWVVLHIFGYKIPTPPLPEALLYKDAEMEFVELEDIVELEQGGGGGGSGSPVDAPLNDQYVDQSQEMLTQTNSNTHVHSGSSNHTNTHKPNNNPPSTTDQDENPFDKPGGNNNGTEGGRNGKFGKDDGTTSGPNKGSGTGAAKRYLVKQPNTSNIRSDEFCTIVLYVIIDADGDIVGIPENIRGRTTTDDSALIKQVITLVRNQAKYNAVSGASNVKKELSVTVQPH